MNSTRFLAYLFIALLFIPFGASAQLIVRQRAHANELPPKFILIQLSSFQNKMEYYKKTRQAGKLAGLKKDADVFNKKMIADYTDNFTICPIYFFADTNFMDIKAKKFDGLVMDKDLRPVKNFKVTDTNYCILTFNHPSMSTTDYNLTNPKASADDPYDAYYANTSVGNRQRPVLLNPDFTYRHKPLPNGANNKIVTPAKGREYYYFQSKNFDISYKANAAGLQRKIELFYKL